MYGRVAPCSTGSMRVSCSENGLRVVEGGEGEGLGEGVVKPEEDLEDAARLGHEDGIGRDGAGRLGEGEEVVKEGRHAFEEPAEDAEVDVVGCTQDRIRGGIVEGG